jgi:hypothetical protein
MGDGEFETPRGWKARADAAYVIGQVYLMTPQEERSRKMHAAYFCRIKEAWTNLPEKLTRDYPSDEHLRKAALIRTGFTKSTTPILCDSDQAAFELALMAKKLDSYAIADVTGRLCTIHIAESQSYACMGKKRFMGSMDATENWIAQLIGCHPSELRRAA